jgi:pyruvate/2-oxoglutarate dehydrogenase complex dihydrolipoamide dehydrogenase (E3) component
MFTDPELARIGLNETEAKQRGIAYRLTKVPMIAVLRTRTLSETKGFLKALIDTLATGSLVSRPSAWREERLSRRYKSQC